MTGKGRSSKARATLALAWAFAVLLLFAVAVPAYFGWDWLRSGGLLKAAQGQTIRDIGLLAFGLVGGYLAIWRSTIAHRNAQTAEIDLEIERYQRGAEMLGREAMVTRVAGIYALADLERDHPESHGSVVIQLVCAFIRYRRHDYKSHVNAMLVPETPSAAMAGQESDGGMLELPPDTREALNSLLRLDLKKYEGRGLEIPGMDLDNSYLRGARLIGGDLVGASFVNADLKGGYVRGTGLSKCDFGSASLERVTAESANLDEASFNSANLTNASLTQCSMGGANLSGANLSGCTLDGIKGLRKRELKKAFCLASNPATISNSYCAETGAILRSDDIPSRSAENFDD